MDDNSEANPATTTTANVVSDINYGEDTSSSTPAVASAASSTMTVDEYLAQTIQAVDQLTSIFSFPHHLAKMAVDECGPEDVQVSLFESIHWSWCFLRVLCVRGSFMCTSSRSKDRGRIVHHSFRLYILHLNLRKNFHFSGML